MAINTGRVAMGGLAAGVAMNALDFLWFGVLLKDRAAAEMNAINPALAAKSAAAPAIIAGVAGDFIVALIIVWIYASIRATWGAGPKTAMRAGLAVWFTGSALYAPLAAGGIYSWHFYCVASVAAFVSVMTGALVGGMIYNE